MAVGGTGHRNPYRLARDRMNHFDRVTGGINIRIAGLQEFIHRDAAG